jgi:phosphoenolpyruvate carboxylase
MQSQLSESIHLLGDLLGEVLREFESAEVYSVEESIRQLAKDRRAGQISAEIQLANTIRPLDGPDLAVISAAFAIYFDLVNLAEEQYRVSRLRLSAGQIAGSNRPGSIGDALKQLAELPNGQDDLASLVQGLDIELVLTAHPTEARRRTLLSKLDRLTGLLSSYHRSDTTDAQKSSLGAQLRAVIANYWLTERSRTAKPQVADEVKSVLFFVQEVIWDVLPKIYQELQAGLADLGIANAPDSWLRIASWVGGDRDGNPFITAEVTAETLRLHRGLALNQHRQTIRPLARRMSVRGDRFPISTDLETWLSQRRSSSSALMSQSARYPNEPYRLTLATLGDELDAAIAEPVRERIMRHAPQPPGLSLEEFLRPLDMAYSSLPESIRRDTLEPLRQQLRIFGLHAARLDLREDSGVLRSTLAETLRALELRDRGEPAAEGPTTTMLEKLLVGDVPALAHAPASTPQAAETWALFRLISRVRTLYGPELLGPFIISMTESAADILTVLLLARWAGCADELQIVPLFETVDDLEAASEILEELFELPIYQKHLETVGQRQMVMIGYSDSNKDGGLLAANWALYQGQESIAAVCQKHGIELTLFHGRGGTVARGGGPANRAIQAQPSGTINGRFRLTIQGETIAAQLANPDLAFRNLEQIINAVLLNSAEPDAGKQISPVWRDAIASMAAQARTSYRKLVYETPKFMDYWQAATPLDEIQRLRIGSRPSSRPAGEEGANSPAVLRIRAIPWVFSWMQSRHNLPGWFGLGSGLAVGDAGLLREMYTGWPFFQAIVDNAEMSLLKADMAIARLYAELVPDSSLRQRIFDEILNEYQLTHDLVLTITGHSSLMEADPTIQRSVKRRNPYVDPLNFVQVELLRRLRSEPEHPDAGSWREAMVLTINGIAAGLRNTG